MGLLVLSVTYMCIPSVQTFAGLIIISMVIGSCDGWIYCSLGPITLKIVGEKRLSEGYGFLLGVTSIPISFGPPLAGESGFARF